MKFERFVVSTGYLKYLKFEKKIQKLLRNPNQEGTKNFNSSMKNGMKSIVIQVKAAGMMKIMYRKTSVIIALLMALKNKVSG